MSLSAGWMSAGCCGSGLLSISLKGPPTQNGVALLGNN